ncbi:MAG: RNA polymerase factor sigma-54 [Phycisphaerae bacterium]|nr:RNA polymerase factor sigma-54 [Phycisphaerae bacterium]
MRFDTSQHMKLGQHMKLAPNMIQSMEILQMSLLELQERIEQELESNVTLELDDPNAEAAAATPEDPGAPAPPAPAEADRPLDMTGASNAEDFERLDSFERANPELGDDEHPDHDRHAPAESEYAPSAARADDESDPKSRAMANAPAHAGSLTEQLRDQWALCEVDPALRDLGAHIISFFDDDGYLRTPIETVLDRFPVADPRPAPEDAARALKAVQLMLEPAGLGARDARECLLLQIDALAEEQPDADYRTIRLLVEEHLDDLVQNRVPRIAARTGLTPEQIKDAMARMRHLSLAPGRRLIEEDTRAVVPDAIVEYDGDADRYIAYLNDARLPNLRVNQEYAKLAKDREAPKETREFIKRNLSGAHWLLDAIAQRKRTILRVIGVVVEAQRDFFDYGPQAIKPLPMTRVADQLGIHVATVSRAVADKWIQTPRGVVPLRKFFTGGTQTESGEDVSWDAIKAALKEITDAEDKKKPLSDDAIADALKAKGLEIARRTVAKYRDQLGIPSARLRKTF